MHLNYYSAMHGGAHVTVGAAVEAGEDASSPCLFHSVEVGTAEYRVYRSSSWAFQAGILERRLCCRNRSAACPLAGTFDRS